MSWSEFCGYNDFLCSMSVTYGGITNAKLFPNDIYYLSLCLTNN